MFLPATEQLMLGSCLRYVVVACAAAESIMRQKWEWLFTWVGGHALRELDYANNPYDD